MSDAEEENILDNPIDEPIESKKIEIKDEPEVEEQPESASEENASEDTESTKGSEDAQNEEPNDEPESEAEELSENEEARPQQEAEHNEEEPEKPDAVEDVEPTELEDTDSDEEIDKDKTIEEAIADSEEVEGTKTDEEIDAVVDEIVRTESDEAIAEADAKIAALKELNKPARYGLFAGLLLVFTAIILLPSTRYTLLNLSGVRVSSSMVVVDSQTRLPLKDINVSLQNKQAVTGEDGTVDFSGLKLGKSTLSITKRGYADNTREIVLGWGSNPIGEQPLVATGEQYIFVLSDWLSGKEITSGEAVSGENSARSDDTGKITLTIGEDDIDNVEVTISADGYRSEVIGGDVLSQEENEVRLVPAKKHVFISNRDGRYDLYKIDADGQNEELLLAATENEREVPSVIAHPTSDNVAFISSRDGEENDDGFVLDGLFIVNTVSGNVDKVTRSEQLQVVGWSQNRLVYSQVVEGTSRGNAERSKLFSYDFITRDKVELASSNYFNDAELVDDKVYYAVSSFAVPLSQAKLFVVNVDGTGQQEVIEQQIWTIYRKNYNTLVFNGIDQKWFELVVGGEAEEIGKQNISTRRFVDSPSGAMTSWTEIKDGKGVLLKSSTGEFVEEQVLSLPGLDSVMYWLNESTVVLRVITNSETADYVVNFDSEEPEPVKITDVTATQRYYY